MIVNKNEEKRLVTLPVLIPNYDDCDAPLGEKQLSIEEIEDFAYKYMEKYRVSDPGHTYLQAQKEIAVPVASWLLGEDTAMKTIDGEETTYPEGTWVVTLKVFDDEAWENVNNGTYNGGSVTVIPESLADEIVAKSAANKGRVLIKDVPDPVAATIALVEKPCVYGAKFCSVKTATKSSNNSKSESLEGKRDKVSNALRSYFKSRNEDLFTYVQLTFDDKVIAHVDGSIGNGKYIDTYFEVPYSINVEGVVEFGEPIEVEQGYVAKKILEVEKATKAGRSISESTFKKLKNAWDSLGKLIDKANNEREEIPSTKSDNMTKTEDKKNTDEYVKKSDLDEALDAKFKEQENGIIEAVKTANETDEDKKKKKIDKIKKELKDLGVDTSEMDFSTKESENDDEEDTVTKKEYDEVVKKNNEYAKQLGIEVESQSLKEDPNKKEVSTKSDSERIVDSMNKTKKIIKEE
jgi:putative serine protease XkdF